MKLVRTEGTVGQALCYHITQIVKGVTKDAVFRFESQAWLAEECMSGIGKVEREGGSQSEGWLWQRN